MPFAKPSILGFNLLDMSIHKEGYSIEQLEQIFFNNKYHNHMKFFLYCFKVKKFRYYY